MRHVLMLVLLVALALSVATALPAAAPAGTYSHQFTFGSVGDDDGQFGDAVYGMDYVASTDRLYVADWRNGRIVVYDGSGNFVENLGVYGHAAGQIASPIDVAIGSGQVWVADQNWDNKIVNISATTAHEFVLGSPSPTALCIGNDGSVWICHTNGVANVASGTFVVLHNFPGNFSDIVQNGFGQLYVSDYVNGVVKKFQPDGTELGVFAAKGSAPGEVNGPWGLALAPEGLVIGDDGNSRVQVVPFGTGVPMVLPAPPGGWDEPDVVAAGGGRIYVCDSSAIHCYATSTPKTKPVLTKRPAGASYKLTRKGGAATWTYRVTVAKSAGGAIVPGHAVKLQKSLNGKKWTTRYSLRTNASGVASKKLRFTARGTTYWRWYSPATDTYLTASAPKTKIVVR